MSSFDWQKFVNQHGLDYSEHGPSTAKGNIYVHCPFCGNADQGKHMGLSLEGHGWGCWKDARHRGKSRARLIKALLGCSWEEAQRLGGGKAKPSGGVSGLLEQARGLLQRRGEESPRPKPLALPRAWKPLAGQQTPHWLYMIERGFSDKQVKRLAADFDLRMTWAAREGWSWRIIIPVRDEKGELVTWTGRAVGDARIRYKTLTPDAEKSDMPPAHCAISDCLLGAEHFEEGGKLLVITEGPFDCMRLSLEAPEFDSQATCLFGKTISAAQIDTLVSVRSKFDYVVTLLDPDASLDSMRMASRLRALNVKFFRMSGKKDPGDMTSQEASVLLEAISDEVLGNGKIPVETTRRSF